MEAISVVPYFEIHAVLMSSDLKSLETVGLHRLYAKIEINSKLKRGVQDVAFFIIPHEWTKLNSVCYFLFLICSVFTKDANF